MNEENRIHLIKGIKQQVRPDGRTLDQYREIKIDYGVVAGAEGSAKVTIGDTVLIAGVKMSIEQPYPDTADQGNFMVNVELLPLSNPEFEAGPPSMEAIELARVTDRGIREAKAIDSKKLCITEGKQVWSVLIDICTINDCGNLFDACSIATLAAIKDARLPKTEVKDDQITIDYTQKTKEALPLKKMPIGITICKIDDKLIVDPSLVEEKLVDSRLTVTSTEEGAICALQKGGDGVLSAEEIEQMMDLAVKKAKEIRKKL